MTTAILLEPLDLAAAGDCSLRARAHRGWECSGRCVHPEARDCAQERDPYGDGRARDCMCECHRTAGAIRETTPVAGDCGEGAE